jgi:hypothetical protein
MYVRNIVSGHFVAFTGRRKVKLQNRIETTLGEGRYKRRRTQVRATLPAIGRLHERCAEQSWRDPPADRAVLVRVILLSHQRRAPLK